jgi:hypothetical protein
MLEYGWSHPVRRHLQEHYGYDRNGPGAAAGTFALPVTGLLRRAEAEAIGHRVTGSIGHGGYYWQTWSLEIRDRAVVMISPPEGGFFYAFMMYHSNKKHCLRNKSSVFFTLL